MSEDLVKIAAAVIVFAIAYITGFLPSKLGTTRRADTVLMLGLAFAGGVFLAAGLIHMLPDAMEKFAVIGTGGNFPIAAALCGVGILGVLLFEKVVAGTEEVDTAAGRQAYLLLAVLSVHSLVAGLTLGLEELGSAFTIILIAILAHKGFAAFSLGVSFARSAVPPAQFKRLLLFFSCTTPVGLIIGMIAANAMHDNAALHFEAIFDSLAAGTFLYVATMDLMHDAFEDKRVSRAGKFNFLAIGFAFMGVLALWA